MDPRPSEIKESLKPIDEEERLSFGPYRLLLKNGLFIEDERTGFIQKVYDEGGVLLKGEESKEEALFYMLKPSKDEVIVLSFFYPYEGKGGIRLDSYSIKLPFKLSEGFKASAKGKELLIADRGEYLLYVLPKDMYRGKVGKALKVKALGKRRGFIITDKGIYIVSNGKRAFIDNKRLPDEAGKALYYGIIRDNYLIIGWKDKALIVSLEGSNQFSFGIFELRPFDRLME